MYSRYMIFFDDNKTLVAFWEDLRDEEGTCKVIRGESVCNSVRAVEKGGGRGGGGGGR